MGQSQALLKPKQKLITLPQNLLTVPHTLYEDFETLAEFTTDATAEADTVNFLSGTQSIKLTTALASSGYINKIYTGLDFSAVTCFRIRFYIPDKTKISAINLFLSNSDANYTNGFSRSISLASTRNGWNTISLIKSDFTTVGAGSWTSVIKQFKFSITGAASSIGVISWDMLTAGVLGTTAVCFSFDDCYESQYLLAYPILKSHKIRGSIFTISNYIGAGSHTTAAELAELNAAGWDICNHTRAEVDLDTLSQANAQVEIDGCTAVLEGYGWTRASRHLAYPSGHHNATTIAAAVASGMLSGWGINNVGTYATMPFDTVMAIMRSFSLAYDMSLATAKSNFDTARNKGYVQMIYGHEIVTGTPSGNQWKDTDISALCDHILSFHVPCVTISELYKLTLGPVKVPK